MMLLRLVLVVTGVAMGGYGGWLLLREQWPEAAVWLVAGVLVHDVLLSGLLLSTLALGVRLLPRPLVAPAAVGLVVLGSVTLMAVPVLGRFGALPDNPTLLDRPYVVSWALLAVATLVTVLVAGWFRGRAGNGGKDE